MTVPNHARAVTLILQHGFSLGECAEAQTRTITYNPYCKKVSPFMYRRADLGKKGDTYLQYRVTGDDIFSNW